MTRPWLRRGDGFCGVDRALGVCLSGGCSRQLERWRRQGSEGSSFQWFPVGAEKELDEAANAIAKYKKPDSFPQLSGPGRSEGRSWIGGVFHSGQGAAGHTVDSDLSGINTLARCLCSFSRR